MKNVTYVTLWGAYLFSMVHICDAKLAYLDDIANLEIFPYGLCFSEVMSFTKIISKMLMSNICNWLLQSNGALTRALAYCKIPCKMKISCIGKFFKPLDNILRVASLARNSSKTFT